MSTTRVARRTWRAPRMLRARLPPPRVSSVPALPPCTGAAALHPEKGPQPAEAAEMHSTMAQTPENKATGAAPEKHAYGRRRAGRVDSDTPPASAADGAGPARGGWTAAADATACWAGQARLPRPEPCKVNSPPQHQPQQTDMCYRARSSPRRCRTYEGAPPAERSPPVPYGMQEPNGPQGNLELRGVTRTRPGRPGRYAIPSPSRRN